jgi:hypothetical protein
MARRLSGVREQTLVAALVHRGVHAAIPVGRMRRLCDEGCYSSRRPGRSRDQCRIALRRLPIRIEQKTTQHPISCMLGERLLLICSEWDER